MGVFVVCDAGGATRPVGVLVQHAAPLQVRKDASHHGGGEAIVLAVEQHHQLVFAPAGVLAPQRQEALGHRGGPGGLAHTVWAVGTPF